MTVKSRTAIVALALVLGACSSGDSLEPNASPAAEQDAVDAATEDETGERSALPTTTRPQITGHAEAVVPTTEAVPEALAFGVQLWIEMGATEEQAKCYAAMFDAEGWDPQTAEDIAELQLAFTDEQSEEFGSC